MCGAQAQRTSSSDADLPDPANDGRSSDGAPAACPDEDRVRDYFGGIRMPPSTRIVSAFM